MPPGDSPNILNLKHKNIFGKKLPHGLKVALQEDRAGKENQPRQ
jgi:hypothetical protein